MPTRKSETARMLDDPEAISELELVRQAQAGSAEPFGVLVERYKPALLRYLDRLLLHAHDAEDMAQETFARAYTKLSGFKPGSPFAPWLFTIATRLAVTHLRSPRHPVASENMDRLADADATVEDAAVRSELRDSLWSEARRLLDQKHWSVLWLRFGESLTVREIADVLDISAIHVKVLLFRARRKLLASKEFLAAFGDDLNRDKKQPAPAGRYEKRGSQ
jgi:RNA polymerase sigma-70 factor, ECF subfamily